MDATTFIGLTFAVGSVILGQVLEGGRLDSVIQLAAALIVLGGTFGAIVTQFPLEDLRNALRQMPLLVLSRRTDLAELARSLVELSRKSRREGLLVLEDESARTRDPFLRTALSGLVDGNDLTHLRARNGSRPAADRSGRLRPWACPTRPRSASPPGRRGRRRPIAAASGRPAPSAGGSAEKLSPESASPSSEIR